MKIYKVCNIERLTLMNILNSRDNSIMKCNQCRINKASIVFLLSKGEYIDYFGQKSLYWKLYVPSLKRVLYYTCYYSGSHARNFERFTKPFPGEEEYGDC